MRWAIFCALLAAAAPAHAQDENALFGGATADAGAASNAAPPAGSTSSDAGPAASVDAGSAATEREASPKGDNALFGDNPPAVTTAPPGPTSAPGTSTQEHDENALIEGKAPPKAEEEAPANPLTVGGTLYLRGQVTGYQDHPPKEWTLDLPNLLDVYFDARPNSRVRALAVGRLEYDPAINPSAKDLTGQSRPQTNALLDQLWINFDVMRTVFVTAGKQHVKWGTGRFWNPTDYLQPVKLNPLDLFDERTGTTMLKAHLPWESQGWNFYGYAIFDASPPVNVVQRVGGAARAEIVLGDMELGLDAVGQQTRKPRFGADLSTGLGPFDVYLEAGLHGAEQEHVVLNLPMMGMGGMMPGGSGSGSGFDVNNLIKYEQLSGIQPQISGGGSWQYNLNDRDALTVGLEGFYNALGYDDASVYPALILIGQYTPFYLGKWYGAAYALVSLPRGQVVNAFNLTTFGNLSDESFLTRLDYNVRLLTHLGIDLYGDVHYGTSGGEFRFSFNSAALPSGTGEAPQVVVPAPLFDAGVLLRVSM